MTGADSLSAWEHPLGAALTAVLKSGALDSVSLIKAICDFVPNEHLESCLKFANDVIAQMVDRNLVQPEIQEFRGDGTHQVISGRLYNGIVD